MSLGLQLNITLSQTQLNEAVREYVSRTVPIGDADMEIKYVIARTGDKGTTAQIKVDSEPSVPATCTSAMADNTDTSVTIDDTIPYTETSKEVLEESAELAVEEVEGADVLSVDEAEALVSGEATTATRTNLFSRTDSAE